jgi:ketosteroid isomerase-like protein
MALEHSPELEQAHHDLEDAYRRRDTEALRRLISSHPATVSRGTDPDEVGHGRDEIIALVEQSADEFPDMTSSDVEALAEGDLGYVYAETTFTTQDGTEFRSRGLAVAHREDGQWRFVHGLASIPVPNEMLTPDSPFAAAKTARDA